MKSTFLFIDCFATVCDARNFYVGSAVLILDNAINSLDYMHMYCVSVCVYHSLILTLFISKVQNSALSFSLAIASKFHKYIGNLSFPIRVCTLVFVMMTGVCNFLWLMHYCLFRSIECLFGSCLTKTEHFLPKANHSTQSTIIIDITCELKVSQTKKLISSIQRMSKDGWKCDFLHQLSPNRNRVCFSNNLWPLLSIGIQINTTFLSSYSICLATCTRARYTIKCLPNIHVCIRKCVLLLFNEMKPRQQQKLISRIHLYNMWFNLIGQKTLLCLFPLCLFVETNVWMLIEKNENGSPLPSKSSPHSFLLSYISHTHYTTQYAELLLENRWMKNVEEERKTKFAWMLNFVFYVGMFPSDSNCNWMKEVNMRNKRKLLLYKRTNTLTLKLCG